MEILVPLALFAMIAVLVCVPVWLKSRERREMQTTVRAAIDKGQPLPPEVIDAMTKQSAKSKATAHTDLRTGVIWLAIALGIGTFGYVVSFDANDEGYAMLGIASIPGFIGLAFIILSFFNKTKD